MPEQSYRPPSFFLPSILLGAGIALGFTLLGAFVYRSVHFFKTAGNNISVRGLAEEIVKSDLASLSFRVCTFGETTQSTYELSKTHVKETMDLLIQSGYKASEIRVSQESMRDRTIGNNSRREIEKDKRYYVRNLFKVTTEKVDEVTAVSNSVNTLVEKGIDIEDKELNFIYSDFLSKRPELLKKAALDARSAAVQVSREMDVVLGDLSHLNQGGVEILSADTTEDGYDADKKSLYKKLRVVFSTNWMIQSRSTAP
jgi:hypothetical protein